MVNIAWSALGVNMGLHLCQVFWSILYTYIDETAESLEEKKSSARTWHKAHPSGMKKNITNEKIVYAYVMIQNDFYFNLLKL